MRAVVQAHGRRDRLVYPWVVVCSDGRRRYMAAQTFAEATNRLNLRARRAA